MSRRAGTAGPPAVDNAATTATPGSLAPPGEARPRPQAMLFTLWGDYVVHRGGTIWVGSLIQIGAEFGLSELALRSVLSRMARADWLVASRRGTRSYYRLTPRGSTIIEQGAARIFRPRRQAWDGRWHLLTYSIPEARRDARDEFRKRLSYLGFGSLAAGAWIAPHDLRAEVTALAREIGVEAVVEQFRGAYLTPSGDASLAARMWPLDELARAYRAFAERWRPVACDAAAVGLTECAPGVDDARAFVLRFWLIHEYQRFFLQDPDLPPELLPSGWPGRDVQRLFDALHDSLAPGANRFFDAVFEALPGR